MDKHKILTTFFFLFLIGLYEPIQSQTYEEDFEEGSRFNPSGNFITPLNNPLPSPVNGSVRYLGYGAWTTSLGKVFAGPGFGRNSANGIRSDLGNAGIRGDVLSPRFNFQLGNTYEISFWYTKINDNGTNLIDVQVDIPDLAGNANYTSLATIDVDTEISAGEWKQVSIPYVASATGIGHFRFLLDVVGEEQRILLDDFSITPAAFTDAPADPNNPPSVWFDKNAVTEISEGNNQTYSILVERIGYIRPASVVRLNLVAGGSALEETDFTAVQNFPITLSFNQNNNTREVELLQVIQDNLVEGNETVAFQVDEVNNASTNTPQSQFTLTITDDETGNLVAVDDDYTIDEDELLTVNDPLVGLLNNDTIAALAVAEIVITSAPTQGQVLEINRDGTFTYQPDPDFFGTDTFRYQIRAENGTVSNEAQVIINVNPINDPPRISGFPQDTICVSVEAEQQTITFRVDVGGGEEESQTIFSTDINDTALNIQVNSRFDRELAAASGDVIVTYQGIEPGTAMIPFRVTDSEGGERVDTLIFKVIRERPLTQDDAYDVLEDSLWTIGAGEGVLTNDQNEDCTPGGSFQVAGTGTFPTTAGGEVILNADGSFSYNPPEHFFGIDSFQYLAEDDFGNRSDSATVTLRVQDVNDAPTLEGLNSEITVNASEPLIRLNLTLGVGPDPEPNTQEINEDASGVRIVSSSAPMLITALDLNFSNQDTILQFNPQNSGTVVLQIFIQDNGGTANGGVDTLVFTLTIRIVQDVPVANNDNYSAIEDSTLSVDASGGLLSNDTDENSNPEDLSVVAPESLTSTSAGGVLAVNADGSFDYIPPPNFFGLDSFRYLVQDELGNQSDTAAVTLDVQPVNDAPVLENLDTLITVNQNTGPLSFAFDLSPGPLETEGFLSTTFTASQADVIGEISLTEGNLSFTPINPGETILTLRFQDDGGTERNGVDILIRQVRVVVIQNVPIAVDDNYEVNEDTALTIEATQGLLGNDLDEDSPPENLRVFASTLTSQGGTLAVNTNGSFTYNPPANFFGEDTFSYLLRDEANNQSDSATVFINVLRVNDAPVLEDLETLITVNQNAGPLSFAFDLSPGPLEAGEQTFSNITFLESQADVIGEISLTENALSFAPINPGETVLTLRFQDDGGTERNGVDILIRQVRIVVIQNVPIAIADSYEIDEEQTLEVTTENGLLANDEDVDTPESLSVAEPDEIATSAGGSAVLAADGSFIYNPPINFFGEDSFTYVATDGESLSDPATVRIVVDPVNDPPIIVGLEDMYVIDSDAGEQNISFQIDPIEAGQDIIDLQFSANLPDLLNNLNISPLGTNPTLTFSPVPGQAGRVLIFLTVQDNGGTLNGGQDTRVDTVVIDIQDNRPGAVDDNFSVLEDSVRTADLTVLDADTPQEQITTRVVSQPEHGTLTLENLTFTYRPAADFFGIDNFSYQAFDGEDSSNIAQITMEVLPVNDAPILENITLADTLVAGEIQLEDRDREPFDLVIQASEGPANEQDQNLEILSVTIEDETLLQASSGDFDNENNQGRIRLTLSGEIGSTRLGFTLKDNGGIANGGMDTLTLFRNVTIIQTLPEEVLNLEVMSEEPEQIDLFWEDQSLNEEGFYVERSLDNGGSFDTVAVVGADVNTYVDTDLLPNIKRYCYRITAFNTLGGSNPSQVKCISINDEILLPNTFTPNGDQRNDRFVLRSPNVVDVNFEIYDRAGNLVYKTSNVDEATQLGWDGLNQPNGIYVWNVQVRFTNGEERQAKGKVNLIR